MQFTTITAAAILAFCSITSATPVMGSSSSTTTTATSTKTSATTTSSGSAPTKNPLEGFSKTQQILLSDTRVDAINNVLKNNEDFVFSFSKNRPAPSGKGGVTTAANRKTFPALTGTGIGGVLAELGPCGFNTPHVHPRAHEFLFLISGQLVSSMFPENGVVDSNKQPREILNNLKSFDSTIYYQGSVHSQYNPSCSNATFFAAQSSEDFGTGQIAQELFGAGNETLKAVFGFGENIDGADIDKFRKAIAPNVALGVEKCLKTCGIKRR